MKILFEPYQDTKAVKQLKDFCHYHQIAVEFVDQTTLPAAPPVVDPVVFDPPVELERGKVYVVRSDFEFHLPETADRLREDLSRLAERAGVEFVLMGPHLEVFEKPEDEASATAPVVEPSSAEEPPAKPAEGEPQTSEPPAENA